MNGFINKPGNQRPLDHTKGVHTNTAIFEDFSSLEEKSRALQPARCISASASHLAGKQKIKKKHRVGRGDKKK